LNSSKSEQQDAIRFKVGAQFLDVIKTSLTLNEKLIDDPITVTALLKQALERTEWKCSSAYHSTDIYPGTWDSTQTLSHNSLSLLGCWPEIWTEGTVIRCAFELNNWGCEFMTVVKKLVNPHNITIQSPKILKCIKRRTTPRYRLPHTAVLITRIKLPFSNQFIDTTPHNISTDGFSFELDKNIGPIPIGSYFKSVLVFGINSKDKNSFYHCAGILRSIISIHRQGKKHFQFGVEFKKLSNQQSLSLADSLTNEKFHNVKSGQGMKFEDLWSFFYSANFIYPKKEDSMQPIIDEVKTNISKLIQNRNSPILRTVVVKSSEKSLEAHQSLLHAYTQTWIIQHLSSIGLREGNANAVKNINLGALNTSTQFQKLRWLRTYYQPQKKSPDRMAGVFARRIDDPSLSILKTYAYLSSPCNNDYQENKLFSVRPITTDDFLIIEKYFISQNSHMEFLSEDGIVTELELQSIQREYQQHGLTRRRQIIIAESHGHACGVAFMEFSAFGLNLSEVTNRCTIHVWDKEPLALKALAEFARDRYRQLGYLFCIIMTKPKHAEGLAAAGFTYSRDYASWTLHHSLFPEYINYAEKIYDRHA